MEGLFRNGANPSFQENTVWVNVLTEQIIGEERRNAVYARLIFFLKSSDNADLTQVIYHNKSMDTSSIVRVSRVKNFSDKIGRDGNRNRMLLFSLFEMFFLNRSESIVSLVKKTDSSFVPNREILNPKAVSLYKRYLNYLRRQGNGGVSNQTFDFEVEKKKIGSFYKRDSSVKLVKMADRFFWKIDLSSLRGLFTNEKHQLKELELNLFGDKVHVSTDGFGIFSKIYELPRAILFENEMGEKFSFKTLKFKVFNGNSRSMEKRAKRYMDYEEKYRENKFKIKPLLRDSLKFYY